MSSGEIILYQADDGSRVRLRASGGTVWLTQAEMAGLYDTSVPKIAQIVRRVLADGEVTAETVNSELMVRAEGARRVRREIKVYNLDMILAVGYRVTTPRAVQFRQWATSVLREYLVKGFAMDDARLAEGSGQDYFDELLERIRAIRASEKRFYQKVRDLYATAVDYRADSDEARTFFAAVQNKMLWAVTGHTAAEIVALRSDPDAPAMGLTSWRGAVVRKSDVAVAKNYPRPRRDQGPRPDRHHVPRLRRDPGPPPPYHDHGPVGRTARRLPPVQRARAPHPRRDGPHRRRPGPRRGPYELYDQRRRALDAQEADEADLQSLRELEHRADPTKDDGGGGHERPARRT